MALRSRRWLLDVFSLGKITLLLSLLHAVANGAGTEEKKAPEEGRLLGSLLNTLTNYNNLGYGYGSGYGNGYGNNYGSNYGNNYGNGYGSNYGGGYGNNYGGSYGGGYGNNYNNYNNCPLCDVTVLSYCGDRLLHDACCCLRQNDLPRQCEIADCSFLHANSCREHSLITRCCCTRKAS